MNYSGVNLLLAAALILAAFAGCRESPRYRVDDYLSPIGNSDPSQVIKVLAVNADSYLIAERALQPNAANNQMRKREEIDGRYVRVEPADFDPTKNRPTPTPPPSSATATPQSTLPPVRTPTPQPSATVAHIADLPRLAEAIRPAVVVVSVFDASGKLLRSGTGFFVSDDGRLITTWRVVEGGVNAVAKSADGAIANVTGVLAGSASLDLALLKVESKRVRPLAIRQSTTPDTGAAVAVVGSQLNRKEGGPIEAIVSAKSTGSATDSIEIKAAIPKINAGAPVVNSAADVIGVVVSPNATAESPGEVRPVSAVASLLAGVPATSAPRWPAVLNASGVFAAEPKRASPTPTPSPMPRILSAPAPEYPIGVQYSQPPNFVATGSFRIQFAPDGRAIGITILRSTGVRALDASTIEALGRWRSEPGRAWQKTVPVTFTRPKR